MEAAPVTMLLAQDGDDLRIGIVAGNVVGALVGNSVDCWPSREPVAVSFTIEVGGPLRKLTQRIAENGNLVAWPGAGDPQRRAGQAARADPRCGAVAGNTAWAARVAAMTSPKRLRETSTADQATFCSLIVLLCTIPGVSELPAMTILAEIGTDMGRFPTAGHLVSWAGLCPGHNESAGKRRSSRMRNGAPGSRRRWCSAPGRPRARRTATTRRSGRSSDAPGERSDRAETVTRRRLARSAPGCRAIFGRWLGAIPNLPRYTMTLSGPDAIDWALPLLTVHGGGHDAAGRYYRRRLDISIGGAPMIDIDRLTEAELLDLNHRAVARLRLLHQARAHVEMLEFKIGDRVTFCPPGEDPITGMLTRYNKKTVTVITDTGRQWNVSPSLLSLVIGAGAAPSDASNVLSFGKRRTHGGAER
jgi:hypothetical protein